MATTLGRRYVCATCGQQILSLAASSGDPVCHGQAMQEEKPIVLPSGD